MLFTSLGDGQVIILSNRSGSLLWWKVFGWVMDQNGFTRWWQSTECRQPRWWTEVPVYFKFTSVLMYVRVINSWCNISGKLVNLFVSPFFPSITVKWETVIWVSRATWSRLALRCLSFRNSGFVLVPWSLCGDAGVIWTLNMTRPRARKQFQP